MATMRWKPSWWREDRHGDAWDRVREAMRRDWEQTLHDVHIKGGHELNQKLDDTVKQMAGNAPLPPIDQPNPAKIVGDWNDVELPLGYGYGARQEMSGSWNDAEPRLADEWERGRRDERWTDVRDYVRRGFEYPMPRTSRPSVH
jgi:hypothetical protein